MELAVPDTGQVRRFAHFLLAWHGAAVNGGRDSSDLWRLEEAAGRNVLLMLSLFRYERRYLNDLGFAEKITVIRQLRESHHRHD